MIVLKKKRRKDGIECKIIELYCNYRIVKHVFIWYNFMLIYYLYYYVFKSISATTATMIFLLGVV